MAVDKEVKVGTISFVPLVPDGWEPSHPVHVVLIPRRNRSKFQPLIATSNVWSGLLHESPWSDEEYVRQSLDKLGVRLAPHARLIEEPSPSAR